MPLVTNALSVVGKLMVRDGTAGLFIGPRPIPPTEYAQRMAWSL